MVNKQVQMKRFLLSILIAHASCIYSQEWKQMARDPQVNIFDVVKEAKTDHHTFEFFNCKFSYALLFFHRKVTFDAKIIDLLQFN